MLDTLAIKQSVAASVLDRPGEVKEIKLRSGRQAFVDRLQQLVTTAAEPSHRRTQSFGPANSTGKGAAQIAASSADPALAFARLAAERRPDLAVSSLLLLRRTPRSGAKN